MTQEQSLISRLNFIKGNVFLDRTLIFSVPEMLYQRGDINVLGTKEYSYKHENREEQKAIALDIGTGECCYGYLFRLQAVPVEQPKYGKIKPLEFKLDFIRPAEFNVYDLLPADLVKKESTFATPDLVIATGSGCEGSGVRLIGTHHPRIRKDIFSDEEFEKIAKSGFVTRLRISDDKVFLDLVNIYDLKRTEKEILTDSAEERYRSPNPVGSNVYDSVDLTKRLEEAGVDIPRTLELAKDYKKIYRDFKRNE